jgi:DNA-binding CsgD family transcriptional regulator
MPLVDAAERGADLLPVVCSITKMLGFDSFVCGLSTSPVPDKEAQLYVYNTLPAEWMALYDKKSYIEVDPRVQLVFDSSMPAMWDQHTERGRTLRTDEFLDDAARYGVCSGLAFALHDVRHHGVMIAFNSSCRVIDASRQALIQRNLGDILLFGHSFHEMFMRSIVERGLPSRIRGTPLSQREREVLKLVACGITTDAIARRLTITARTVQFHLDSLRGKLDAANRQEAVALAVKAGYITINA